MEFYACGYGCTRILPKINYELIKNNPKALIGFSDITALLSGVFFKTGLVGFHGPVGSTLDNEYSIGSFQRILQGAKGYEFIDNVELTTAFPKKEEYERYTNTSGNVNGALCGGSLIFDQWPYRHTA